MTPPRRTAMPGIVLLDAVLAIALFVVAGGAILMLSGQAVDSLQRSRLHQQACELARAGMSRLEAGLDTPMTLNGPLRFVDGSLAPPGRWEVRVETEPSAIRGLTSVAVTASRLSDGRSEAVVASCTLRQLVRLGARPEDTPGDDDPMASLGGGAAARARSSGGGLADAAGGRP
ncbi:MAG: hypothetical protein WD749_01060 [Phycisphaerales bacterium]